MTNRTEPEWIDQFYDPELHEVEYGRYYADDQRAQWQSELIVKLLGIDKETAVLDLACGRGRHALRVAEEAARVTGTDRSPQAIALARQSAAEAGVDNVTFQVEDMRDLAFRDEFDAAYNWYTSWGYYSDEENLDVLARVRQALRPGGRFLLELVARDLLVRSLPDRDFGLLPDGTVVTIVSTFDPATGRCTSRRTYYRPDGSKVPIRVTHHIPAPDHLAKLFSLAGFTGVELKDGITGDVLDSLSPRVIALGRRT